MSTLSASDVLQLAQAAGAGGDPRTAAAVALAESGGDPSAVGRNSDQWNSRDRGLWQINDHWHPEVSDACAFDAACNARAAYAISSGWTDFSAWTTYASGAYRQYLDATASAAQAPPQRSLAGQGVVGQMVQAPWFAGAWEVTQGWGAVDYEGEPEGHGFKHWHAGVDIGLACGTVLSLPLGLSAQARHLDNPGGYGTALVLLLANGPAVLLGHLQSRLVDDGAIVRPGDAVARSNNTGNSTGCHLHFEVRPQDPKRPAGIAAYGSDVDPSGLLLTGAGEGSSQLLSTSLGPAQGIADAIGALAKRTLGLGQVALGASLLGGGLLVTAYAARGQSLGALATDARQTVKRSQRRSQRPTRPVREAPAPREEVPAAETRVRPDLR